MAGGNVPVKGILIDGVVIENSSLVQGSTELIQGIMLSLLSSSEQTVFFSRMDEDERITNHQRMTSSQVHAFQGSCKTA